MSRSRASASGSCARLFAQARELVASLAPETYCAHPGSLSFSTVGAHLRHAIDDLDCLLAGVETRSIDYTARRRCLEVETSSAAGLRELARAIEALEKLDPGRERIAVDVRCEEGDPWVASTLARELSFVASHAIHHFALMRLGLAMLGHDAPADFGVSPSTLAHRDRRLGS